MPGAIAYRDVGKGREQERKLCRGCPIETIQYRMCCMVGPVKIRLAARGVPQGGLSHEPNAGPTTVSP